MRSTVEEFWPAALVSGAGADRGATAPKEHREARGGLCPKPSVSLLHPIFPAGLGGQQPSWDKVDPAWDQSERPGPAGLRRHGGWHHRPTRLFPREGPPSPSSQSWGSGHSVGKAPPHSDPVMNPKLFCMTLCLLGAYESWKQLQNPVMGLQCLGSKPFFPFPLKSPPTS